MTRAGYRIATGPPARETDTMPASTPDAADAFVAALVARDLAGARDLLAPEVDFRAMTPNRFWEAADAAGAEDALRAWFEHPDRDVSRVDAGESGAVADTRRVGWRVSGTDAQGAFTYEQLAFAREDAGRIVWLRIMCSGPRPVGDAPGA